MAEEIIIDVDAKGGVVLTVRGYKGVGCKDLTRNIEKALGETISDKETSEYREREANVQSTNRR